MKDDEASPGARSPIQAIDRSVALLRVTAQGGPRGLPLRALAAAVDLRPSTARTLLSALVTHGLLRQNGSDRTYLLGPTFFELNRAYVKQSDLASSAAPVMYELWKQTDETVHLAVLQDAQRVDVSVLVSQQLLNVNPTVARFGDPSEAPPFRTAAGKVLFAALSRTERESMLASAPWRRSVSQELSAVEEMVEETARQGFATNFEEEAPGVCGVAAPVHDHSDQVVAALCIGYPAVRRTPAHDEYLRRAVVSSAEQLSSLLGARGGVV